MASSMVRSPADRKRNLEKNPLRVKPGRLIMVKATNSRKKITTMKKGLVTKAISAASLAAFMFLVSCEDRLDLTATDSQNVQNEALVDGFFEDADDMASAALTADDAPLTGARETNGRGIAKNRLDNRFTCDSTKVTLTFASDNTPQVPHGFITIDFREQGCADGKGNTRKGKINVEYKGRRFAAGSTVTTTFDNYRINEVKIEGTRTVTNSTSSTDAAPQFTIKVADGKATFPDGKVATRNAERTRTWIRTSNPLNDSWEVTGNASGTNRNGKTYSMAITKKLVYKRECAINGRIFMAVEGTKELTVDGKKIVIDYGAGECDRLVTITINGVTQEVLVRGDI